MQEADFWSRCNNGLAIQFQHHPQHPMRRRVLRAHIQGHPAGVTRRLDGNFQTRRIGYLKLMLRIERFNVRRTFFHA
jgi:hypothetical protein